MIKVNRSQPAPASLAEEAKKKNGQYNKPDVVERLKNDFNNKCYICGMDKLQDPEVEHRLPHKNGIYHERKFDWNNLFLSCRHCNSVKNKDIYDTGIIDCCTRDPEECLIFDFVEDNISVSAKNPNDIEAQLTAKLMYEVFNTKNTGIRTIRSQMRLDTLLEQMNILITTLKKYKDNPKNKLAIRILRAYLQKESAFAEFKRAYVRKRLNELPSLQEYLE